MGTTTTTPDPPPTSAPTSAFALIESDLVELDATNGAVRRTIVPLFEAGGVFRGDFDLTADRSTMYYGEGYEDSWFSCDTSLGSIGRVDLASGSTETLVRGWSPSLTPDGNRLAYVTSSLCLPDPDEPDIWVLTPGDRVVVVDLASSASIEIVSSSSPTAYDDPAAIDWVSFHPGGDLLVSTAAGAVHRVPGDVAGTVQSGPIVFNVEFVLPVAVYDESFIGLELDDEGASAIVDIDLDTGSSSTIWESEFFVAADGDRDGRLLVIDADAPATSITPDLTVLALEEFIIDVAW